MHETWQVCTSAGDPDGLGELGEVDPCPVSRACDCRTLSILSLDLAFIDPYFLLIFRSGLWGLCLIGAI